MSKRYQSGIVSRFVDYTSSGDPVAKLILVLGIAFFLFALLLASLVVVVPIGAVVALIVFLYRYNKRQKLKVIPNAAQAVLPPASGAQPSAETSSYPKPDDFAYGFLIRQQVLEKAEAPTGRHSCTDLAIAFAEIGKKLYVQEGFHTAPAPPLSNDPIALGRYYDQLDVWRAKTADPVNFDLFVDGWCRAYLVLREHFPSFALYSGERPDPSPFTVPLSIAMNAEQAGYLAGHFDADEYVRRHIFQQVREQLAANHAALAHAGMRNAGFDEFFAQTPLTDFVGTAIPVPLADEVRFAGMWVIAPQGLGKTTLLHDLLIEDVPKDASIILMDSKGDLIEPLLKHAAIAHRRIVIGPDNPIGMNPLDIPHTDINKAVDNLEYLFSSLLDFKLTAGQAMLLKAVLRSLVTVFPKPTLATFQDIMSNGPKKYADYINKLDPDLQNFFKNEFSSENIKARRQEVLQRLRSLLDNDVLRSMLLAPSTTFRIGEAMDQGAVIIINNSRARLGNKGAEFFGRFFIAQVLAAAQQRSFRQERDKKPVYFYIDEAHTVIAQDERITDVLHECRSQKIALVLAHQETIQVSDKVLSALENCAIRFAHPDEEARKLAGPMRMEAKALQSMHRGQFAAYIRGLAKEGFVVNVARSDFTRLKAPARPNGQRPTVHAPPPDTTIYAGPPPPSPQRSAEDIVKDSFRRAHPHIQQAIKSDEFENYLRGLAKDFDETAYNRFENEVMLVLIGAQPVEDLLANLQKQVPLAPEFVRKMGKELELFVKHILEQASTMPPESPSGAPKEPIVNFNPRPLEMEPWRLDSADKKQSKEDSDDLTDREPFDPKPEPPDGPAPQPSQKRRWDPVD